MELNARDITFPDKTGNSMLIFLLKKDKEKQQNADSTYHKCNDRFKALTEVIT